MTRPKRLLALVSLLGLLVLGCSKREAPSQQKSSAEPIASAPLAVSAAIEEPTEQATNAFAKAANTFGVDFYGKLPHGSDNLVFSPASLAVALTMAWAGARGDTAAQMANVLHLPESADDTHRAASALLRDWSAPRPEGLTLRVANRLFLDRTFEPKPEFSTTLTRYYRTPLERLDFQGQPERARGRINDWVKTETEQKISELIPEGAITGISRLVLTNAIYFLGRWTKRFEREKTVEQPFYVATDAPVRVPMMRRQDVFRYGRLPDARVLELGYEGGRMAMLVVLPDVRDGLPAVESSLSSASISRFVSSLAKQEVQVFLPRFRIDPAQPLRCKPVLEGLGMVLAFERGDFSGMAAEKPLDVQDAYHKAFIEVDEAGTEAAAATAVVMHAPASRLEPPPIPEFRADHPFLFFLRDTDSGAILFMGRVADPSRG